jgi:hypothetical protein
MKLAYQITLNEAQQHADKNYRTHPIIIQKRFEAGPRQSILDEELLIGKEAACYDKREIIERPKLELSASENHR